MDNAFKKGLDKGKEALSKLVDLVKDDSAFIEASRTKPSFEEVKMNDSVFETIKSSSVAIYDKLNFMSAKDNKNVIIVEKTLKDLEFIFKHTGMDDFVEQCRDLNYQLDKGDDFVGEDTIIKLRVLYNALEENKNEIIPIIEKERRFSEAIKKGMKSFEKELNNNLELGFANMKKDLQTNLGKYQNSVHRMLSYENINAYDDSHDFNRSLNNEIYKISSEIESSIEDGINELTYKLNKFFALYIRRMTMDITDDWDRIKKFEDEMADVYFREISNFRHESKMQALEINKILDEHGSLYNRNYKKIRAINMKGDNVFQKLIQGNRDKKEIILAYQTRVNEEVEEILKDLIEESTYDIKRRYYKIFNDQVYELQVAIKDYYIGDYNIGDGLREIEGNMQKINKFIENGDGYGRK